ncbi:hypothetical protein TRSC58_02301 [Trypanosoma rangeli SC58]|uniref:DUF7578 domain-containing protein n=1 Tax=Trypanosoma rangeli SC58 TaxID=429131 RepID=A0A061J9K3_TRYRA|nr:hypothetical protein TRSC58_02301 [Trypanosoma rangeli SC58]
MLHRAGSGLSGGSDELFARRRRVEQIRGRRKWALASSVEGVLYVRVGRVRGINLNEFLRSTLGGSGVVPMNENVSIGNLLCSPGHLSETEMFWA